MGRLLGDGGAIIPRTRDISPTEELARIRNSFRSKDSHDAFLRESG